MVFGGSKPLLKLLRSNLTGKRRNDYNGVVDNLRHVDFDSMIFIDRSPLDVYT